MSARDASLAGSGNYRYSHSLALRDAATSLSSFMNSTTSSLPGPTPSSTTDSNVLQSGNGLNAALSFFIGLLISVAASLMNAGGLNLTKLDHVRTAAMPKSSRRHQFLRPLWVLGMLLYILSQIAGSTLALQFLRAEYVAPLGSTSLIFNFLFASWLVGTPVTKTDIRGTIVVVVGVIGIVVFGSIHSSEMTTDVDLARLQYFWSRASWWGYFIAMTLSISVAYCGSSLLEAVLAARSDTSLPESSSQLPTCLGWFSRGRIGTVTKRWAALGRYLQERMEKLTDTSDDKMLAWTLGIGWSCCGGAMAGGCLVFAKSCISLSVGPYGGSPFTRPAAFFTLLLLCLTGVLQIICLNRGLQAWDSTLVVPVFYAIYTCSGFLDSLVFFDEIDYYQFWVLSMIFLSITVLIAGVILLSSKKPEKTGSNARRGASQMPMRERRGSPQAKADEEEGIALTGNGVVGRDETLWEVGEASDDEDTPGIREERGRDRPSTEHVEGRRLISATGEEDGSVHQLDHPVRAPQPEDDDFGEFTTSSGRALVIA